MVVFAFGVTINISLISCLLAIAVTTTTFIIFIILPPFNCFHGLLVWLWLFFFLFYNFLYFFFLFFFFVDSRRLLNILCYNLFFHSFLWLCFSNNGFCWRSIFFGRHFSLLVKLTYI